MVFADNNERLNNLLENYFREFLKVAKHDLHSQNCQRFLEFADMLRTANQHQDAILCYKHYLRFRPSSLVALHNMALSYRLSNLPQLAIFFYKEAISQGLSNYQVFHNLGNAHFDLNELDDALSCYFKALEYNSNFAETYSNIFQIQWCCNVPDPFQIYRQAIHQGVADSGVLLDYFDKLVALVPESINQDLLNYYDTHFLGFPRYIHLKAKLVSSSSLSNALKIQENLLKLDSVDTEFLLSYATNLLRQKDTAQANQVLKLILKKSPDHQEGIGLMAITQCLTGTVAFEQAFDPRLIQVYPLELSALGCSQNVFIEQLLTNINDLHVTSQAPFNQTLSGGTQSLGEFFACNDPFIQILRSEFERCANLYLNKCKQDPSLALLSKVPNAIKLSGSWSVRLGSGGSHRLHVHPMGWCSAVFYVQVPESSECGQSGGDLIFGYPENILAKDHVKISIQPQVGSFIFFPSYFWHGTSPFENEGGRTTVAVDFSTL